MNTILEICVENIVNPQDYEIKLESRFDGDTEIIFSYATIFINIGDDYEHELTIYSNIECDLTGVKNDMKNSFTVEEAVKNNINRVHANYDLDSITEEYEFDYELECFINDVTSQLNECVIDGVEHDYQDYK